MTKETSKIVAGLREAACSALSYGQRGIAEAAHAAKRIAAEARRARTLLHARAQADRGAMAALESEGEHGLNVDGLRSRLDDLTEHFGEQERALATLDEPAASLIDHVTLEAELEAVKGRVRGRRGRIAKRAAAQARKACNVEARARRLEQCLEELREGHTRLLALERAIATVDAALIASVVEIEEAAAQLAASERELTSYAQESALLQERSTAAVASDLAAQRVQRIGAKLTALQEDADALRAHDAMSRSEGASTQSALRELLSQLRAGVEECASRTEDGHVPGSEQSPAPGSPATTTHAPLDADVLRVPLEQRLRMLEALAQIRVEETQARHAAGMDDPFASHAAFARVRSAQIHLLLEQHERAWILDALEAAGHEQGARLSHGVDREPDALASQLQGAVTAWRHCDDRLEETAARTRAAQLELASLHATLAPATACAHAEVREQSARIRERQRELRVRTRSAERTASRLRAAGERRRALAKSVRRARDALDRELSRIVSAALRNTLGRLAGLERDIEAAAALVAGLRAAHEQVVHAITAMEQDLLLLSRTQPAAAKPPAPPATNAPAAQSTEKPWTRARMEIDVAALAEELEHWKDRHAQLERRVETQAGQLASVEAAQRHDEALAEFRLELEDARSIAAASLERALGVTRGTPGGPAASAAARGHAASPSPGARSRRPR